MDAVAEQKIAYFFAGSWNTHLRLSDVLIQKYGLETAAWVAAVLSRWRYYNKLDKLDKDGYVYITQDEIRNRTTISPRRQSPITGPLKKDGMLLIKRKGTPPTYWYKFDLDTLLKHIEITPPNIPNPTPQSNLNGGVIASDSDDIYINNYINKYNSNYSLLRNEISVSPDGEKRICSSDEILKGDVDSVRPRRRPRPETPTKDKAKDKTISITSLMTHWNNQYPSTQKHRLNPSTRIYKNVSKSCNHLFKQGHTKQNILDAIDVYVAMVNARVLAKVSMDNFFSPSRFILNKIKEKHKDFTCLYDECRQGEDYIRSAHCNGFKPIKDKYPSYTTALKRAWAKDIGKVQDSDENAFRKAAINLDVFLKANRVDAGPTERPLQTTLRFVMEYLVENKVRNKSVHVGWLVKNFTWDAVQVTMKADGFIRASRKEEAEFIGIPMQENLEDAVKPF